MDYPTLYKHVVAEACQMYLLIDLGKKHLVRARQLLSPNEAADYNHQLYLVESNFRWITA